MYPEYAVEVVGQFASQFLYNVEKACIQLPVIQANKASIRRRFPHTPLNEGHYYRSFCKATQNGNTITVQERQPEDKNDERDCRFYPGMTPVHEIVPIPNNFKVEFDDPRIGDYIYETFTILAVRPFNDRTITMWSGSTQHGGVEFVNIYGMSVSFASLSLSHPRHSRHLDRAIAANRSFMAAHGEVPGHEKYGPFDD
ncbi:hypothetical protein T439DRAFT_335304 [Meredithblackwellia eburnea MCA 4105]